MRQKFVGHFMNKNNDVITFISKPLYFKRVANLADIIKIEIFFIKKTFKDSINSKEICEKMLMSVEVKVCVT